MRPLLSVLIDTYNQERYIEQAVVSAVEQDFPASDYEILVVDDGSTDRTPEIVRKFEPRVRLLRKKNGGQASAFNAAVAETQGDIVAFLDGDDWFAPNKLTAVINALEERPEVAAVGHAYYEENGEAGVRTTGRQMFLQLTTREGAREASWAWHFLLTSALTVRRTTLEVVMPIHEGLTFCADGPIAMAAVAGGAQILEQPLMHYRRHSDSFCVPGDLKNRARLRSRCEVHTVLFELLEPLLVQLGVSRELAQIFLCPYFTVLERFRLSTLGGKRLDTFRTEMRLFRAEVENPGVGYRFFKYAVVGGATLALPPPFFYKMRDWYGRQNLGKFRDWVLGQA